MSNWCGAPDAVPGKQALPAPRFPLLAFGHLPLVIAESWPPKTLPRAPRSTAVGVLQVRVGQILPGPRDLFEEVGARYELPERDEAARDGVIVNVLPYEELLSARRSRRAQEQCGRPHHRGHRGRTEPVAEARHGGPLRPELRPYLRFSTKAGCFPVPSDSTSTASSEWETAWRVLMSPPAPCGSYQVFGS